MSFFAILPALTATLLAQDVQVTRQGVEWVLTDNGQAAVAQTHLLKVIARGHLVIRGTDGDQVTYRITERVRTRSYEEARRQLGSSTSNTSTANGVTTLTILPKAGSAVVTLLEISIPRRMASVILQVQPGDIEAFDLDGNLRAETAAGQIHCDRIRGSVQCNTGGGEIRLGKIGGEITCMNHAGSIIVDSAGAAANCQTLGGEIQIREAAGPLVLATQGGNIQVDHAGSSVDAHTDEGVIEIAQANGIVSADTRGGSIQIGSARGVRCQSGAGPVRVKTSSGPLQIQTALGSILAELFAGARIENSSLVAGTGDITVLIPSNIALSVLARNDSGSNPRIVSDFSELHVRTFTVERPAVVYQGAINGGGPLLTLNTAAGIIWVKKSK
jgi:DUF4097 and DUF4098 domain-containing protein YvlB